MSDSFLVFFDFDILSTIKGKNPFGCYYVILILNLSRLISQKTLFISKVLSRLISQLHFWFLKFDAFDFSNDSFDFQNLSRLISQMTLLISKIYRIWFFKWHFWFPKFGAFDFSNETFDFQNLTRFDFSNDTFDFQNFASFPAGGSPLVWWVYTWPVALLFSASVWLLCQAKEFVKMLRSVMEFSHYYVRLLLDVLCKLTTLWYDEN